MPPATVLCFGFTRARSLWLTGSQDCSLATLRTGLQPTASLGCFSIRETEGQMAGWGAMEKHRRRAGRTPCRSQPQGTGMGGTPSSRWPACPSSVGRVAPMKPRTRWVALSWEPRHLGEAGPQEALTSGSGKALRWKPSPPTSPAGCGWDGPVAEGRHRAELHGWVKLGVVSLPPAPALIP